MPPPRSIQKWIYARRLIQGAGFSFWGTSERGNHLPQNCGQYISTILWTSCQNKTRLSNPRDRKRPFLPFLAPAAFLRKLNPYGLEKHNAAQKGNYQAAREKPRIRNIFFGLPPIRTGRKFFALDFFKKSI